VWAECADDASILHDREKDLPPTIADKQTDFGGAGEDGRCLRKKSMRNRSLVAPSKIKAIGGQRK
jgi:hypothetical protein